jgi:hypothetical protein
MLRRLASRVHAPLLALALLAPTALGTAQPRASTSQDELRARVARLRQNRPASVPEGTLLSIEYLLDIARRIEQRFPTQSAQWTRRAERFLESAERGRDPYVEGRGQILNRGYDASFSPARQGYAIYIPPNYDPQRAYPMLIMLHGGSSLGNLFLGVVLGNNMDWLTYSQHLWDDYTPRWSPEFIVVAPDGVGQPIWRWMGEQDVLEVLADVQRHYNVDPNRVVLGGLSNGGMGAYQIGTRHAWRFSHVQAIAGAPSWLQYTGGRPTEDERTAMLRVSGMHLFENTTNTDFRYYHGTRDPGPMRPAFVRELTAHVRQLGLTPQERWYEHGHDLLYLVHRHGRIYEDLARYQRNPRPPRVRVVTGDYRANRQHWVSVTRVERYPELARVDARVESNVLRVETNNVLEVTFHMDDCPLSGSTVRIEVDGARAFEGPRSQLGATAVVSRQNGSWRLGALPRAQGLEKVPGLAGPMSDAYFDEIIHVYGTRNAANVNTLRDTANRGANGWPQGVWYLNQRVIPDTEVTDAMMRTHHLALYGSPGDNAVLDRIAAQLPIRVENGAVVLSSGQRFAGNEVGARFVYPNPLAANRYVLVHTGVTANAVSRTRNLPDFLPDYVVYDRQTTGSRPRLIAGRNRQLAAGYFDRFWRLSAPERRGGDDGDESTPPRGRRGRRVELPPGMTPERMRELAVAVGAPPDFVLPPAVLQQTPAPELEPGPVPPAPSAPRRFLAPASDPNGALARQLARAIPSFYNYRAIIPGGAWTTSPRAVWQIRSEEACLRALDEAQIPYERVTEPLTTPTPTPVRITGAVGGVAYTTTRVADPIVLSCEMAARLPVLSRIARAEGVRRIEILSSHRTRPNISFHRMGMALDIFAFDTPRGRLSVNDHFVETPAHRTCEAPEPSDWRAAALLRIACALATSERFSSILTPNYNDGHRNHFHIDIRPDDDRIFVR